MKKHPHRCTTCQIAAGKLGFAEWQGRNRRPLCPVNFSVTSQVVHLNRGAGQTVAHEFVRDVGNALTEFFTTGAIFRRGEVIPHRLNERLIFDHETVFVQCDTFQRHAGLEPFIPAAAGILVGESRFDFKGENDEANRGVCLFHSVLFGFCCCRLLLHTVRTLYHRFALRQ